jgi:ABC-type nitrate/sulfonate/bicarbonate transport system substrate-binding protein
MASAGGKSPSSNAMSIRSLKLGILRLTDAAPLVVAQERGFFAAEGLTVELSVEPSWANIADKLTWGLLDGAMILPPLAIAIDLGLRGAAKKLVLPLTLSLNGNNLTFAARIAKALDAPGATLASVLRGERRPRIAVVHAFSTQNLLLRYFLAAGGVDPERDVTLTVVPPAEMVEALGNGRIDGFCAGAPWGALAARAGIGRTIATSSSIWSNGQEKAFAVPRDFAERAPATLQSLLRALLAAGRFCDDPANGDTIAALLAAPQYLAVDAAAIRASLPGAAETWGSDTSVFFANAATFPWRSQGLWFLQQMSRWGYLAETLAAQPVVDAIWRPDLYATAATSLGLAVPAMDAKVEGVHGGAWSLAATPAPITMGRDLFCDGSIFDPFAPFGAAHSRAAQS